MPCPSCPSPPLPALPVCSEVLVLQCCSAGTARACSGHGCSPGCCSGSVDSTSYKIREGERLARVRRQAGLEGSRVKERIQRQRCSTLCTISHNADHSTQAHREERRAHFQNPPVLKKGGGRPVMRLKMLSSDLAVEPLQLQLRAWT